MTRNKSLGNIGVALLVVVTAVLGLVPGAWAQSTYKTLYKFTKGQDGWFSDAGVIFDQAGNLYGTTFYGGDHGAGTVFKLTPNSDGNWTESVLYSFCSVKKCDDGSGPASDLIFDVVGNLYGTTSKGDPANAGTVFKLTPNPDGSWTESVLYSFCSVKKCAGRGGPTYAPLIFDAAGNLYGTTANDGAYGTGSVFKLTPNSDGTWTERVLHSFVCTIKNCDGIFPGAGVIFDAAGNLYGTTESGGAYDFGTVFELIPKADGSWKEKVLHHFTGGKDEGSPGSLIFDAAGNLYGTTYAGGFHSWGTVFELSPKPNGSWTQRVLHRFTGGQDGAYPFGLIFDQAGSLYGTTLWGGDPNYCMNNHPLGCGVVFKLVPKSNGGWNETVLRYFFDHPGAHPLSELILDATGNLYGTTSGDDSGKRNGTVFEVTP